MSILGIPASTTNIFGGTATSPATAFSSADALGTALTNNSTTVKTPEINYPSFTPQAAPTYVAPTVNQAAPDESEFNVSQQMEMQDYANEASQQEQQAAAAMQYAGEEAYQTAFTAGQARENEAIQYTAQGVSLQGSPLLLLEQTRQQGLQQVTMLQQQGYAQANLGYENAAQTLNQGRATLLGQQTQFSNSLSNWATQQGVSTIGQITNASNNLAQYANQNTQGISQAYNQREPIYQVNQNNTTGQALGQLGNLFSNTQRTLPGILPNTTGTGNGANTVYGANDPLIGGGAGFDPSNATDPLTGLSMGSSYTAFGY